MMKKSTYCVLVLLLLNGCMYQEPVKPENPEVSVVESIIREYYDVMSARDWETYRNFFTDQAVLTTIWQQSPDEPPSIFSTTISEFIDQTPNGPDSQPIFEEKPIDIIIEIKGNLASGWVKYEAKFGSQENLVQWKGRDHFSLIKFDGSWKIAALTYATVEE